MREPNFKTDDEIYGKFGENDFLEFCHGFGLNVVDVSSDLPFQLADIDFLVSTGEIDISNPKKLLFSPDVTKRNVYKFEVKADTRSYDTRNVVYEVISHDFAGCMAESKADYVYYVFIEDKDGDGSNIIKKEAWKISLKAWRKFLRVTFFSGKFSRKELRDIYGVWSNNYNTHGDEVANIMCNIEILEKLKIAKKL